jgi:hypothetical protein
MSPPKSNAAMFATGKPGVLAAGDVLTAAEAAAAIAKQPHKVAIPTVRFAALRAVQSALRIANNGRLAVTYSIRRVRIGTM